ncbi:hypothetical protein ACJX0J_007752 [Zea mays]
MICSILGFWTEGGSNNHLGGLPKLNFPTFDGSSPKLWQTKCEKYFEMHDNLDTTCALKWAKGHKAMGHVFGCVQFSPMFIHVGTILEIRQNEIEAEVAEMKCVLIFFDDIFKTVVFIAVGVGAALGPKFREYLAMILALVTAQRAKIVDEQEGGRNKFLHISMFETVPRTPDLLKIIFATGYAKNDKICRQTDRMLCYIGNILFGLGTTIHLDVMVCLRARGL